ncbi:MAG: type II toxin-antitoxin system PemK/MazF family toxin [Dokdonella sp.]|uniref:type II toxin-antitoxin system PemK/MazF family toxin n=1 Tax=Dokdonella sp. TaxID=2291710 RepID=UPI003F8161FF
MRSAGSRPVLVLSADAFNRASGLLLVAPIMQGGHGIAQIGFSVTLMGSGTKTQGVVVCDQTRTVDARTRGWRRIEKAPAAAVEEALDAVRFWNRPHRKAGQHSRGCFMDALKSLPMMVRDGTVMLLAELIRRAATHGPERWGLTDLDTWMRLNVGWTESATVTTTHLRLIVAGNARGVRLPKVELIEGDDGRSFYATVPGSLLAEVPYMPQSDFVLSIDALRPALFEAVDLAARRRVGRGVRNGHSPALAAELELLIGEQLPATGYESEHSDSVEGGAARMEGALARVLSSRYERDRTARLMCVSHYGAACVVCGFSFEETYGELGVDFIHVHHLVPLSDIGHEYQVDPIRDLRPVCPNCHAMLHRGQETLSMDDLRALLTRPK